MRPRASRPPPGAHGARRRPKAPGTAAAGGRWRVDDRRASNSRTCNGILPLPGRQFSPVVVPRRPPAKQGSGTMTSPSRDEWLDAEWLEADGLGGFASGTVGGVAHAALPRAAARRDHAADRPRGAGQRPRGLARDRGRAASRSAAQRYAPDVVHPDGQRADRRVPRRALAAWTFRAEDGTEVSQEIVACHGRGEVVLRWRLRSLPRPGAPDGPAAAVGPRLPRLHHENARLRLRAPRSPARACCGGPIRALPAISAIGQRQLPPRPGLVPQLPLRRRARARPRLRRGPGLARRLQLDAERPRRRP